MTFTEWWTRLPIEVQVPVIVFLGALALATVRVWAAAYKASKDYELRYLNLRLDLDRIKEEMARQETIPDPEPDEAGVKLSAQERIDRLEVLTKPPVESVWMHRVSGEFVRVLGVGWNDPFEPGPDPDVVFEDVHGLVGTCLLEHFQDGSFLRVIPQAWDEEYRRVRKDVRRQVVQARLNGHPERMTTPEDTDFILELDKDGDQTPLGQLERAARFLRETMGFGEQEANKLARDMVALKLGRQKEVPAGEPETFPFPRPQG
jgi:hypothetical protein